MMANHSKKEVVSQQKNMAMTTRTLHTIFCAITLALSLFALMHFLNSSWLGDRRGSSHHFDAIYNGTAPTPFSYRVLVPILTKTAVALTPQAWQEEMDADLKSWAASAEIKRSLPWMVNVFPLQSPAYPRLIAILLIYGALLGYAAILYKLSVKVFPDDGAIRYFAPLVALISISSFSWPLQHIYDMPLLFLSAGCYYCIFIRQWRWYAVFFILACLNRETSIFILIFFAFWFYKKLDTQTYVRQLALQGLAYAAIAVTLGVVFADNPDWFARRQYFFPVMNDLLGRSSPAGFVVVAAYFWLLTYRWQQKPAFLKTSLALFPLMYAAYLVYGFPKEYRVFFDLMPLLALLATHTLVEAAGFSKLPIFIAAAKEKS